MKVVNIQTRLAEKQARSQRSVSAEASLKAYTKYFSELLSDTVKSIDDDEFSALFHYQVRFSNPQHDFNGVQQMKGVFQELLRRSEAPQLIIRDSAVSGQHGFVYWKFVRNTENKKAKVLTGMSRIRFDGYGRVVSHRDIWDSGVAPRRPMPRFRDWWRKLLRIEERKNKRAAPPKEFHGSPPF